jgi:hypothetical protein
MGRKANDEDEFAWAEIRDLTDKEKFLREFDTLEEVKNYLDGEEPFVSDLVIISKDRPDGTVKKRLILNLKSSGVTAATKKHERVILPRSLDVIWDCLELLHELPAGSDVDLLVLDFLKAFWHVPTAKDEQPFLVFKLRGK